MFSSPFENQAPQPKEKWRSHVDWFVQDYQEQLSALAWGLQQEWGDGSILGIDLQPKPHFIPCTPKAIQTLNKRVGGRLQEIVGIIEGADFAKETIVLCLGGGQVKLIYFEEEPTPPNCFATHGDDLDKLIADLETAMGDMIKVEPSSK